MKPQTWLAAIAIMGCAAVYAPQWVAQAQDDTADDTAKEEAKGYESAKAVLQSLNELTKDFADPRNPTEAEVVTYFGKAFTRIADHIDATPDATDHAGLYAFAISRSAYAYGQAGFVRIGRAYLAANPEAENRETWKQKLIFARLGIESEKEAAIKELKEFETVAKSDARKLLQYADILRAWYENAEMTTEKEAFAGGWPLFADYIEKNPKATDHDAIYTWAAPRGANAYANKDFVRIARAYLKAKPDAKDVDTWQMNLLYARLGIDTETKGAQADIKKAETAAKADPLKLLEYAELRLKWYVKAENKKDKAALLKKLDTDKVFTGSKDEWVARRVHRLTFAYNSAEIKDGEAFPDWAALRTVKDLDGEAISIADYKGKIVLIDFWAVWCGPCMLEMPNVIKLYEETHGQGFEVIGISLDREDGLQGLKDTIAGNGKRKDVGAMPWRQIYDGGWWSSGLSKYYGVNSIPKTVLIDHNGIVVAQDLRGAKLDEKVKELLAAIEKPVEK